MNITDAALLRLGRMVSDDLPAVGLVLHDRYEVEHLIARGGMGEIFRARDRNLGRLVAIKILSASRSGELGLSRFEAEARTTGRIDHPGIVPVHDLGTLPDGRLFYVMKLVDGETLEEKAKGGGRRESLVGWIADACAVVRRAHESGVIHRDLKPTNVMVDGWGRVYVLDWGIARFREGMLARGGDGSALGKGLTSAGAVMGTLGYLSPEQARGEPGAVDERSDVYGLGAVLYEILAGRPPHEGANVTEILEAVVKGGIPSPHRIDPSVPADLESICLRALALEPKDRYGTVAELEADLRKWLGGEAVTAHPATPVYRAAKGLRRHRRVVGVAVLLGLATALFLAYWVGTREERALAEARRREAEILGPIEKRLAALPETPEGRAEGIGLLEEALGKYDGSWSAWMKLAEFYDRSTEDEKALEAYGRATAINPRLSIAHYLSGRILMDRKEDYPAARREFERALEVDPENEYAFLGKARLALLEERPEEALRLCDAAEPISSHLDEFYLFRGHLLHHDESGPIKNLDRAIEDFTRVIERNPSNADAWSSRGYTRNDQEEYELALPDLDRAIELNPNNYRNYRYRALANRLTGRAAESVEDITEAIRRKGDDPDYYEQRGYARVDLGDLEGAMADAEKAIAIDPDYEGGYICRGNVYGKLKEPVKAIADYTRAAELDPDNRLPYYNRAIERAKLRDYEGAIRDYDSALERDPEYADALAGRGIARMNLRQYDEALSDLDRAIEIGPPQSYMYLNRGNVHRALKNPAKALIEYGLAIDVARDRPGGYVGRGIIFAETGKPKEAVADFDTALRLDPESAGAYLNRGVARGALGDKQGMYQDYLKSVELEPANPIAQQNLGWALFDLGRTKEAEKRFTKGIELFPNRAMLWYSRCLARSRLKDIEGALADIEKALDLGTLPNAYQVGARNMAERYRKILGDRRE